MNRLSRLATMAGVVMAIGGVLSPAHAYKCYKTASFANYQDPLEAGLSSDDKITGTTSYRDTTLYKKWHELEYGENDDYVAFTGDFSDANEHSDSRRFWVVNGLNNQIDSIKFWLLDENGNLLVENSRGKNVRLGRAAKFQIPWKDGYQLNMRVTWELWGVKQDWKNVFDGDEDDGWLALGGDSSAYTLLAGCR